MLTFARFVEESIWEGETWTFWIQVEGNENALSQLEELTLPLNDYTLDLDETETEAAVDVLVKYADVDEGYFVSDTKLIGRLVIPEAVAVNQEALDRALYKGGIQKFMAAP